MMQFQITCIALTDEILIWCAFVSHIHSIFVHAVCFCSFSNLFNSSNKPVKKSPTPRLRYNAPTSSPQRRPTSSPKTAASGKNRRDRLGSAPEESAGTVWVLCYFTC